jgi:hypothetical protein
MFRPNSDEEQEQKPDKIVYDQVLIQAGLYLAFLVMVLLALAWLELR